VFEALLERLARALDRHGIPYMVIGGQAVLLYGEPRLTRDIDLTIGWGPDQVDRLLKMTREENWKVLAPEPAAFVQETFVLPCLDEESGIRLDFVFSLSDYEQKALGRVHRTPMGAASVRFASVEDILIHKLLAGRPRDLEDARSILLKNHPLDQAYLTHWLDTLESSSGHPLKARLQACRPKNGPA
jgi:hypothetical protein